MLSDSNPVDIHVGKRLRQRRTFIGMTQEQLGVALGITFQQIQKYERGANRIGASRLFDICRILDVTPQFFFEEMPEQGEGAPLGAAPQPTRGDDPIDRETMDLVRAYRQIDSAPVRHRLLELARALAKGG
ncbi:helix-turn-helix transcriptional regulator [Emcibacter sp. SYSU 3D8]|uniref:helix-turn-helix domain-containing protein n=1 Tax=Emcibacter sp. SYSU 3D8 TaxID=3133969 RepID=UPI0031FEDFC6